ncbi:unnamed protein product [Agarophyton chilense]
MSVYTAGASSTSAKLVRSLTYALKTTSANCKPLLDHCRSQNAFSTISADDTELFFTTVAATLTSDNERTIALSLEVLCHALTTIPPYLLRSHWLHITQKLTSLLKSSKWSQSARSQAKLLTVMASAVASASSFSVIQPEMKTVISKICQSSLFHALRALSPMQNTDYVCKAALCLVFAVLGTAPREVRTIISQLESGLRERWLFHRNPSVRNSAVLLFAHLLACHGEKAKAQVFEQRLVESCKQLDDIMNFIDMFGPSDGEKRPQLFDDTLRNLSLSELEVRVTTICAYIRHVVGMRHDVLMPMPLPTLYRVLLRGIGERYVDAYATGGGKHLLDTDSVLILINSVTIECAETLISVTAASGKDATIVFTHQIGQCLETKLSHVVLRSRKETGVSSNLNERRLMYRIMGGLIEVMGSGIVQYVSGMLEELFSVDVKLCIACSGRDALLANENKGTNNEGNNRSRKRKRFQNQENRQERTVKCKELKSNPKPLNALDEHCAQNATLSKQTLQDALDSVISVFEHRAYMSERVSQHVQKIEEGIIKLMKNGVLLECVIHAANAAGLSGGCNRMYGEASDLLLMGSRMCVSVLHGYKERSVRREAARSRSGYESIIHARGPAFYLERLCNQQVESNTEEGTTGGHDPETMGDVHGGEGEKDDCDSNQEKADVNMAVDENEVDTCTGADSAAAVTEGAPAVDESDKLENDADGHTQDGQKEEQWGNEKSSLSSKETDVHDERERGAQLGSSGKNDMETREMHVGGVHADAEEEEDEEELIQSLNFAPPDHCN